MKSPVTGVARDAVGCVPNASGGEAASRPAPAVVEMADFNKLRRSILVIPDVAKDIAIMTGEADRDDYVRGNEIDAAIHRCGVVVAKP
jgi:hypothetical protein